MVSYSSWNGTKMTGNKSLLTDMLKDRMGFRGVIVTDWNGHAGIKGCTPSDCPQALNAGNDMYMIPDGWKQPLRQYPGAGEGRLHPDGAARRCGRAGAADEDAHGAVRG